jgi:hypothetical protein
MRFLWAAAVALHFQLRPLKLCCATAVGPVNDNWCCCSGAFAVYELLPTNSDGQDPAELGGCSGPPFDVRDITQAGALIATMGAGCLLLACTPWPTWLVRMPVMPCRRPATASPVSSIAPRGEMKTYGKACGTLRCGCGVWLC